MSGNNNTVSSEKLPITGGLLKEFKEHAIIPKPDDLKSKTRTVVYVVDSRDRNRDRYPDPANYRVDLNDEFRNIQAIELLSIQMPTTVYTINENNDQLTVSFGDTPCTVTLLHGVYADGNDLATAVQEGLNRSRPIGTPRVCVYYNSRLHRLVFSSPELYKDGSFRLNGFMTLHFAGNEHTYGDGTQTETQLPHRSCGEVLGFCPTDYDMYIGNAYLNPLANLDEYEEQYGLLDKDSESDSEVDTGTHYILRSIITGGKASLGNSFYMPLRDRGSKGEEVPGLERLVRYIYVRQIPDPKLPNRISPFIALRLRGPQNCTAENIDSYLVEAEMDYDLPHGEYQVFVDYIVAPQMVELHPWKYLMLRIPKCHRFQSSDKTTIQSFAKIPLAPEYQINHLNALGVIKRFRPTLASLSSLHIQFYPYKKYGDSTSRRTFDFAGAEHVLVFALVMNRQSSNYT
jgi:hypothetical protein